MKMRNRGTSRVLVALLVLVAMSARGVVPRDFCLTCAKEYAQCQPAAPAAEHTCCQGKAGGCGTAQEGEAGLPEWNAASSAPECYVVAGISNFLVPENAKQQVADACALYVLTDAFLDTPHTKIIHDPAAEARAPLRPAYQSNCVLRI